MPITSFDAEPHAARDRVTRRFRASDASGSPVEPGTVLEWADRIGRACATAWAGLPCLLVHVGEIRFLRPVEGEWVDAEARVVQTGRTTVQVLIRIASGAADGLAPAIATCFLIYVATDAAGDPAEVPAWEPSSIANLELGDRAGRRAEARSAVRAALRNADPLPVDAAGGVHAHLVTSEDLTSDRAVAGGRLLRWIHDGALAAGSVLTGAPMRATQAIGTQLAREFRPQAPVDVESRVAATGSGTVHVAVEVRTNDAGAPMPAIRGLISLVPVDPATRIPELVPSTPAQERLTAHALTLARILDEIDAIGEDEDW